MTLCAAASAQDDPGTPQAEPAEQAGETERGYETPPPWELSTDEEEQAEAPTEEAQPEAGAGAPGAPRTRPHFVKGELSAVGSVRPFAQHNFVGIAAGLTGLPSGADTVLNSYYLTVEPTLDLHFKEQKLRLGLGMPLEFMIVDTRALFQKCFEDARVAVNASGDVTNEQTLAAAQADAAACSEDAQAHALDSLGEFREAGLDERSDFAKAIRYLTLGHEESNYYLNVSRLYAQSLGHGTVIRRYNANLDFDTTRVGATLDAYYRFIGFESVVNDVMSPDLFGFLGFLRPLEPFSDAVPARSFSLGVSYVGGYGTPKTLEWEDGFLPPTGVPTGTLFPLARLDEQYNFVSAETEDVAFVGFDAETKLIRTQNADLKPYFDYQSMQDHGSGSTLGTLWRFSFGQPARHAIRLRAEGHLFDADYMPSYFDTFYEVDKYQYRAASYRDLSQAIRAPTKLALLEAQEGGPTRLGGYLEFTYSWLRRLQLGFAIRGSRPTEEGEMPRVPDYSTCVVGDPALIDSGELVCGNSGYARAIAVDPSYASMLLHLEVPIDRFQLFATYEAFGVGDYVHNPGAASAIVYEGVGLDAFSLNGDNEVLFTGVRGQVWPFLFVQAEARRFFFVQRFTDIDVEQASLAQDNNFHSEWTFAASVMLGWGWE